MAEIVLIPKRRYSIPKALPESVAYRRLKSNRRAILDDMVKLYIRNADEEAVSYTAKMGSSVTGNERHAVMNAINELETTGYIVCTVRGSYASGGHPSRYRLNMFPFKGEPPDHPYLEEAERRRFVRRQDLKFTPEDATRLLREAVKEAFAEA
jgi:hypothetical protein